MTAYMISWVELCVRRTHETQLSLLEEINERDSKAYP